MLFGVRSHCECGVCGCSMHALFPPTFLQHLQVCASGLPALALSSLSVRWHRNRSHEGTLSVRFFPSLSKWGSLGRFVLVSPLHPFVPAVSLQRSCVITACNTSSSALPSPSSSFAPAKGRTIATIAPSLSRHSQLGFVGRPGLSNDFASMKSLLSLAWSSWRWLCSMAARSSR